MKTIWKYPIGIDAEIKIEIPMFAEILTVQVQYGEPNLWVLVDEDNKYEVRKFICYGTGHQIECKDLLYIGTFQLLEGKFVWHLFEKREVIKV